MIAGAGVEKRRLRILGVTRRRSFSCGEKDILGLFPKPVCVYAKQDVMTDIGLIQSNWKMQVTISIIRKRGSKVRHLSK